jgi:hypothetical protein
MSQFRCSIELLFAPLSDDDPEAKYLEVGEYDFLPALNVNDEVSVFLEVWDKEYILKTKVVHIKTEVIAKNHRILCSKKTIDYDKSAYLVRIFVEAEDRDSIVEIRDAVKINKDAIKINR